MRRIDQDADVILVTEHGTAIRFSLSDVRPMGRVATGVKGIALRGKDRVVSAVVCADSQRPELLTVAANGLGKRTEVEQYRVQSRGGKGIINMRVTPKTGPVIGAIMVAPTDELILLTSDNKVIRFSVSETSSVGRATQGVRLVRMENGGSVVGYDLVQDESLDVHG